MQYSPLSVVHPNAKIGNNVTISPFVTIDADVEIGDNTWIGPNAVIMAGARVGQNCQIFPGAVLAAAPQDLKFGGEPTILTVGDNTIIRECATLNRGTSATGKTTVGSNCLIMAYAHVAHDCIVGDHCVMANNATLAGHVELEQAVIIGGMVAIQQFTKIGAYSMLGGGTLHNKDVPPYIRVARHPAAYIGVNSIGLRRRGFAEDEIREIQDIYHLLFVAQIPRAQAIAAISEQFAESKYKTIILDFINNSKQGILKGFSPSAHD
jgi:UDP-N-acetylglucosamine acyltransferase